jgi:septal ring factor EnvC (AmiA/AmiB activator)
MRPYNPCHSSSQAILYCHIVTILKVLIPVLLAVNALCFFPIHSEAGDIQSLEKERIRAREIESEIKKTRKELEKTVKDERQIILQMDRLEQQLNKNSIAYQGLQKQILDCEVAVQEARSKVRALKEEVRRLEIPIGRRLVSLYKTQKAGYPALILSARGPNEALKRYHNLTLILRQDALDLFDFRNRVLASQEAEKQLVQKGNELLSLQKAQQEKVEQIETQKMEKQRLLAKVKGRKDLQQAALRDFEASSKRLQALILSLEESATERANVEPSTEGSGFGSLKGRLPSPVAGTVGTRFGRQTHPMLKTYTLHNGIEITAPEGAEIRAIHPGVVIFADWIQGYGNVIIIDHGLGYYTLCGHVSALLRQVGDKLQKGEVIARVGDTGSLVGPSLYFEIRERGKPVDPLEWISLPQMSTRNH